MLLPLASSMTLSSRLLACMAILLAAASHASAACPTWAGAPVVQPILPCDSRGTSQSAFNNLAWQDFIALNWAADPAMPGQPNLAVPATAFGMADTSLVVWETYKASSEVFRPNGQPPLPWSAAEKAPAAMAARMKPGLLKATTPFGVKTLFSVSKLTAGDAAKLNEFTEAGAGGAWLTAQPKMNNYLALFEKRINQDEYNYIKQNQLYVGNKQASFALKQGLNLPDGSATFSSYGTVGAIEIKAAWIQLDNPADWPQFKTSKAWVSYPTANGTGTPPKLVTVGLVALHIIRKTPNAQQFVWSTFEHVNNAPSINELSAPPKSWYTFYNLSCDPKTDYYHCMQNQPPQACKSRAPGCTPDPYDKAVQVVRTTPISNTSANNIAALNSSTWQTILASNPKSVFLNYQLVNVLWPNSNTPLGPGATVPLPNGDAQPPVALQPVANAILETYNQKLNCLSCHTGAPIANQLNTKLGSDYSFLFDSATNPPPVKAALPVKAAKPSKVPEPAH